MQRFIRRIVFPFAYVPPLNWFALALGLFGAHYDGTGQISTELCTNLRATSAAINTALCLNLLGQLYLLLRRGK